MGGFDLGRENKFGKNAANVAKRRQKRRSNRIISCLEQLMCRIRVFALDVAFRYSMQVRFAKGCFGAKTPIFLSTVTPRKVARARL
jgi:hypothetical protein